MRTRTLGQIIEATGWLAFQFKDATKRTQFNGLARMFLAISCALLSGCATMEPIKAAAIVPPVVGVQKKHTGSVQVKATAFERDAQGTNPVLSASVFAEALKQGIVESGVFSAVKDNNADFLLEVKVVEIQCSGAKDLTADLVSNIRASWQLTRLSDRKVMFSTFIDAEGETEVFALYTTRARVVAELATKNLIKKGIESLGRSALE